MNDLVPVKAVANTNNNIFTGIKYAFKGRLSHKYLDGRAEGYAALVADRNAVDDDMLKWYIYPVEDTFYSVRGVKSRCFLDGRDKSSGEAGYFGYPKLAPMMANRKPAGDHPLHWSFESTQGYYALKGRSSEKFLNGGSIASDGTVLVNDRTSANELELHWSYMPMAYKFNTQIVDFKYDEKFDDLQKFAKPSQPFVVWTMENQSHDVAVTVNPDIHHWRENYNSWTFTQSKERSFVSSIVADIVAESKGVGSRTGTMVEWSTGDTRIDATEKRIVDTTEISMTSDITIPPRKRVSYSLIWSEVDVSVDYTATVRVTGLADRARRDGTTAPMERIPAAATSSIMRHIGYDGEILGMADDVVTLRIKGVMHAKGAVNGMVMMSTNTI